MAFHPSKDTWDARESWLLGHIAPVWPGLPNFRIQQLTKENTEGAGFSQLPERGKEAGLSDSHNGIETIQGTVRGSDQNSPVIAAGAGKMEARLFAAGRENKRRSFPRGGATAL